jgi:hypothetical protein
MRTLKRTLSAIVLIIWLILSITLTTPIWLIILIFFCGPPPSRPPKESFDAHCENASKLWKRYISKTYDAWVEVTLYILMLGDW